VWLAFVLMLMIFHHSKVKKFLFGELSCKDKKKTLARLQVSFLSQESSPYKTFLS
jgi:hypothetical protein